VTERGFIMQEMARRQKEGPVISMERLHEIVDSGVLCGLCTEGVYGGAQIGAAAGEYTRWSLKYTDGQQEHLYTLN
jgi:hypothetical protein